MKVAALVVVLLVLATCRREDAQGPEIAGELLALHLPDGFPVPVTPDDNPLTLASAQLGKALFFDRRLSRDGTLSCASCHRPDHAFSDTSALSVGVDGSTDIRNAPSLANVAFHPAFFRDAAIATLEQQAISPVHNELEMDHSITVAAAALGELEPYRTLSQRAYGKPMGPYELTRALASYERTLISGWSRYDRYRLGDAQALTASEVRGLDLFQSERLNCTACHAGFDLSDHALHNIGQYLSYADPGRERITLRPGDHGLFMTPTLRNIALTAPYMHDGAMSSLDEVVDHFASGGLPHVNRDAEMRTFVLSPMERKDLIAFLRSLTDERSIDQVP